MDRKKNTSDIEVNDSICNNFQDQVSKVLIRHKSVLDIITKLDEYNSRVSRAVAKSVTNCGCISINAKKQDFSNITFEEMASRAESHLEGHLCDNCKDVIEEEIGSYLFYLAALSNTLNVDLSEIIEKENDRIKTLGIFNLT
ncbi:MAG: DUF1573 domain-containing protein [Tissierellia bacterium]|nr:DUF1573 domain-containing protein [Tissierellia bacterium]MDD4726246.1 DUF1573 domain-containing protein [Tissierellia bacterium]